MRIRQLTVDGYRHFKNQRILFDDGSTVLAGANNSGKTSLIDLLTVMLSKNGHDFGVEDLNAVARHHWSRRLLQAWVENGGQIW